MSIIELLQKEFEQEVQITRKMLSRVPNNNWDYRPHPKSMSMLSLTTHIAELPSWITMAMTTSELDFEATPYNPRTIESTEDLLNLFEESVQAGRASLSSATEEELQPTWVLRSGTTIHATFTKYEVIRHSLAQTIHHRAQLGVYLRLLDIPIPGSYGPSADEQGF